VLRQYEAAVTEPGGADQNSCNNERPTPHTPMLPGLHAFSALEYKRRMAWTSPLRQRRHKASQWQRCIVVLPHKAEQLLSPQG
jgi:hypothetical protein